MIWKMGSVQTFHTEGKITSKVMKLEWAWCVWGAERKSLQLEHSEQAGKSYRLEHKETVGLAYTGACRSGKNFGLPSKCSRKPLVSFQQGTDKHWLRFIKLSSKMLCVKWFVWIMNTQVVFKATGMQRLERDKRGFKTKPWETPVFRVWGANEEHTKKSVASIEANYFQKRGVISYVK